MVTLSRPKDYHADDYHERLAQFETNLAQAYDEIEEKKRRAREEVRIQKEIEEERKRQHEDATRRNEYEFKMRQGAEAAWKQVEKWMPVFQKTSSGRPTEFYCKCAKLFSEFGVDTPEDLNCKHPDLILGRKGISLGQKGFLKRLFDFMSPLPQPQAEGPPKDWEAIRKASFPDCLFAPEDAEKLYDATWVELRKKLTEGVCLWSIDRAVVVANLGEESLFVRKAELLRRESCIGVRSAVEFLNTLDGHVACPEGFCIVFSDRIQSYILLCRSDRDVVLESLPDQAIGQPTDWQDIRKACFPDCLIAAEKVEIMYDGSWMALRRKLIDGTCLWSMDCAVVCASVGEEHLFLRKAELLRKESCIGVRSALDFLNTLEGHVACPEGFCVVFSDRIQSYILLCRSDRNVSLKSLPDQTRSGQAIEDTPLAIVDTLPSSLAAALHNSLKCGELAPTTEELPVEVRLRRLQDNLVQIEELLCNLENRICAAEQSLPIRR